MRLCLVPATKNKTKQNKKKKQLISGSGIADTNTVIPGPSLRMSSIIFTVMDLAPLACEDGHQSTCWNGRSPSLDYRVACCLFPHTGSRPETRTGNWWYIKKIRTHCFPKETIGSLSHDVLAWPCGIAGSPKPLLFAHAITVVFMDKNFIVSIAVLAFPKIMG